MLDKSTCVAASPSFCCNGLGVLVVLLLCSVGLALGTPIDEESAAIPCGLSLCEANETCEGSGGPNDADSDCYHCKHFWSECRTRKQRPRCRRFCEDLLLKPFHEEIDRLQNEIKGETPANKNDLYIAYSVVGTLVFCIVLLLVYIAALKRRDLGRSFQRFVERLPLAKPRQTRETPERVPLAEDVERLEGGETVNPARLTADHGTQTDTQADTQADTPVDTPADTQADTQADTPVDTPADTTSRDNTPIQEQQGRGSTQIHVNGSPTVAAEYASGNAGRSVRKFQSLSNSVYSERGRNGTVSPAQHSSTRSESDLNQDTYIKQPTSCPNRSNLESAV